MSSTTMYETVAYELAGVKFEILHTLLIIKTSAKKII